VAGKKKRSQIEAEAAAEKKAKAKK